MVGSSNKASVYGPHHTICLSSWTFATRLFQHVLVPASCLWHGWGKSINFIHSLSSHCSQEPPIWSSRFGKNCTRSQETPCKNKSIWWNANAGICIHARELHNSGTDSGTGPYWMLKSQGVVIWTDPLTVSYLLCGAVHHPLTGMVCTTVTATSSGINCAW